MKNLKLLAIIFIATLITSNIGIYAYSTGTFKIDSVKIGGADKSVYTSAARTKEFAGNQTLTDIDQNHKNTAALQYYNTYTNSWKYPSDISSMTGLWNEMTSKKTLIFPEIPAEAFYPSVMQGDYRVRIKEVSWHLTDGTLSATYNPGNN